MAMSLDMVTLATQGYHFTANKPERLRFNREYMGLIITKQLVHAFFLRIWKFDSRKISVGLGLLSYVDNRLEAV